MGGRGGAGGPDPISHISLQIPPILFSVLHPAGLAQLHSHIRFFFLALFFERQLLKGSVCLYPFAPAVSGKFSQLSITFGPSTKNKIPFFFSLTKSIIMKSIISSFAMVGLVSAHQLVTHFHINGTPNQDCVRLASSVNPILDLNSDTMACNAVKGNGKTKCTVKGKSNHLR